MLKKMISISMLAGTFLFVGCTGGGPNVATSDDVYQHTTIENNSDKKGKWAISPITVQDKGEWANMRAFIKNGKPSLYQVYVVDLDDSEGYYDSAYDSSGKVLEFVDLGRAYGSSVEIFAVTLSRQYLNNTRTKGINFKAVGKQSEQVFTVPAHVVDGFLRRVDAVK